MAVYFLDSSAVVKRYLTGTGSVWVKGITDPAAGNKTWVSALAGVEVLAALYRRVRTGVLSLPQAQRLDRVFRADLNTIFGMIEPEPAILAGAMRLVGIHPLRAMTSCNWRRRFTCDPNTRPQADGSALPLSPPTKT